MKIGIMSDIHGDVASLELALALFANNDVEMIVCAGDLVEKGANEDEVVARLQAAEVRCVQGNHDENAVRHSHLSGSLQLPEEVPLRPATIEYLQSLPSFIEIEQDGVRLLVVHAIPSDNGGAVFHLDGASRLSKKFKKDLARTDCAVVVVGHTHYPFDLTFRDKRILNPGATCRLKPRDSHTASILDLESSHFEVYRLQDSQPADIMRSQVS